MHLCTEADLRSAGASVAQKPEGVAVSVITEAKLQIGAVKSSSALKTLRLVENFLRPLAIFGVYV